jgi:diguanylate cyclase (GGDEF)-like protein
VPRHSWDPADERRTGFDQRSQPERRSGLERRASSRPTDAGHPLPSRPARISIAGERATRDAEPAGLSLRRVFPYAPFDEREAPARYGAIEAHRRDVSGRLARDIGAAVAGLDYLHNISRDLVAPTVIEREVLEVLERRSVTDPLTGLFNRYHFETALKREVARCLRHGVKLSLLLLDVDQLKGVNDRWGHQVGDRVLAGVASAIQESLRGTDVAARYGGDEFAVILPDTDAPAGRIVAERICKNVRVPIGEEVEPGIAAEVTVSGGLAALPPAITAASEVQLIVAADQALYLAKGRGGNCVTEAAS